LGGAKDVLALAGQNGMEMMTPEKTEKQILENARTQGPEIPASQNEERVWDEGRDMVNRSIKEQSTWPRMTTT